MLYGGVITCLPGQPSHPAVSERGERGSRLPQGDSPQQVSSCSYYTEYTYPTHRNILGIIIFPFHLAHSSFPLPICFSPIWSENGSRCSPSHPSSLPLLFNLISPFPISHYLPSPPKAPVSPYTHTPTERGHSSVAEGSIFFHIVIHSQHREPKTTTSTSFKWTRKWQ